MIDVMYCPEVGQIVLAMQILIAETDDEGKTDVGAVTVYDAGDFLWMILQHGVELKKLYKIGEL